MVNLSKGHNGVWFGVASRQILNLKFPVSILQYQTFVSLSKGVQSIVNDSVIPTEIRGTPMLTDWSMLYWWF